MKLLTRREMEVRDAILKGLRNKEIAAQQGVCVSAVKFHACNIYRKYKVRGRMELALRFGQSVAVEG